MDSTVKASDWYLSSFALRLCLHRPHDRLFLSLSCSFLDAGADVDARCLKGKTPLMYAARLGRIEEIDILLNSGANVDLTDGRGMCALHYGAKVRMWDDAVH